MARLPDVESFGARPIPQSRERFVPSAQVGAGVAAGINSLADAGFAIREKQDKLAYAKAKSDFLLEELKTRAELQEDPDWETYETRYRERTRKAREATLGQIKNPLDRAAFEQDSDFDIERGAIAVRGFAKAKEVDSGRATVSTILETNRNAALEAKDAGTRTALIQASSEALRGAREKGYISEQEETSQWQKWTADYGEGFLDVQTLPKRIELLKSPKGTPADFVAPDRRANLLKQAEREMEAERRAREAEQRARLMEQRQLMSQRLQDIQVGAQLGLPIDVPDRATLQALYGAQEGAQKYQMVQKLATLSSEVSGLQQLSGEELLDKVNSYRPTQVEGAEEQSRLYGFMQRSASQILDAREKDPAGYLIQFSPAAQKAWQNFPNDPQGYIRAVNSEKERLGISGNDILPNGYVEQLADEINTAGSAEKTADRIEEESQRWGTAWPDVLGQLGSKIPDTAMIIGSGIPRSAATALAATSGLKDTELKALLPGSTKPQDVQEQVQSKFADFIRSLPPEAARTAGAVTDAAYRLSLKYMNDGAGLGDAVKRAYRDLVESQYSLVEFRGKTLRIPAQLDARGIEDGAQRALERFEPDAKSIDVPPGAAFSEEEYAGQLRDYVRKNGYWVTRPDAKGLRLYADGGPVVTSNGPVDITWEDLQADVSQAAIERSQRMQEEATRRMDRR